MKVQARFWKAFSIESFDDVEIQLFLGRFELLA